MPSALSQLRIGVSLILLGLLLALVDYAIFSFLLSVFSYVGDASVGPWFETLSGLRIPSILTLAFPLAGLVGIFLVEADRGRSVGTGGRAWDRARIAVLVAAFTGAGYFFSGIVVGFVDFRLGSALLIPRAALVLIASMVVGLYLLWTAMRLRTDRVDPLVTVAFAAGALSVVLEASAIGVFLLNGPSFWFALPAVGIGVASLALWAIVFARILRALPRTHLPDTRRDRTIRIPPNGQRRTGPNALSR